ncbi:MAG: ABC transporter substrate-binding protein [Acidobacteria bacterium]|nr:ABC transporter substrate-binding protein [Acidobacteriota bacterium]
MSRAPRAIALFLALAAALSGCSAPKGDLVIGVVGPLSGPLAFVGEAQRRGAEIAAAEINDRGGVGGRLLRIEVRDDSRPERTVGILRDLTTRERAVAVLGPETATPVLGSSGPVARAGIPVFLAYPSIGEVNPPAAPNVFRMLPADSDQAGVLADWIVRVRRIRTVAIASAAETAARAAADLVARAVAAAGGRVVARRDFSPGDVDQTSVVRRLKASGAGALVVWGTPSDAARIATAVRVLRWRTQIAGPLALFVADYRSLGGAATEDTMIVLPFRRDWFSARTAAWLLGYHTRFGIVTLPRQRTLIPDLPVIAMAAYDAVVLAAEAVRRAGTDPRGMIRALEGLRGFHGVATRYTFGPRDHEAFDRTDLWAARFLNFAVLYDVDPRADLEEQIAFYKIQVSAYYVPDSFFSTDKGAALRERILEDVLTNPESVEFFRAYRPPRPPPGPV